jgi:hypothetical protein
MRLVFVVVVFVLLVSSLGCLCCSFGPKQPEGGEIVLGELVEVASSDIGSSGGSVVVDNTGGPLDGLKIDVPAGAFAASKAFKVSYMELKDDSLGEYFNHLTPLIIIDNGGGYSEKLVTVKIPVSVPEGEFPMAFYYDKSTGKLEGIPTIARDQNSITIASRHFSDIVVSSIDQSVLYGKGLIDSGFKTKVDNWQFVNKGSYIARGGHCAGQSITAMWYYTEKRLNGAPALYGLYDDNGVPNPKTPALQEDDSLGYKFASTIQNDIRWDEMANILDAQINAKYDDEDTLKEFAYAILLTGEPQLASIWGEDTGSANKDIVGHAIVAYKVSMADGVLYVSDPNYPADAARTIKLENLVFKSYSSGSNADYIAQGRDVSYDRIRFLGKTAVIPWGDVAGRWAEFQEGTIGEDRFPACRLETNGVDGMTGLTDGFYAAGPLVNISVSCSDKNRADDINPFLSMDVYSMDNGVVQTVVDDVDVGTQVATVSLAPGVNKIGVYTSIRTDHAGGYVQHSWTDFQWITINGPSATTTLPSGGLYISPSYSEVMAGEAYTLTAVMDNPPANALYVWDFSDSGSMPGYDPSTGGYLLTRSNSVTHPNPHIGDYNVSVSVVVLDESDQQGLDLSDVRGTAESALSGKSGTGQYARAVVVIKADYLKLLQKTKYVELSFGGEHVTKPSGGSVDFELSNNIHTFTSCKKFAPLVWDGVAFRTSFSGEHPEYGGTVTVEISGTMSKDGRTLESITATQKRETDPSDSEGRGEYTTKLAFAMLDGMLSSGQDGITFNFASSGAGAQQNLLKAEYKREWTPINEPMETTTYESTKWNTAQISVRFYEDTNRC